MKSPDPTPEPTLRPHVFDGIQEYDQRLPNWWLYTLYGSIIFSVVYWFFFLQSGLAQTDQQKVEARFAKVEAAQLAASLDLLDDGRLWAMSRNTEFVSAGQGIYTANCAVCHGPNLAGGIGLALNTPEWKYGGTPIEIFNLVSNGSPNLASGMKAWRSDLGPQRIAQVVAFVLSHHDAETTPVINPAKAVPGAVAAP